MQASTEYIYKSYCNFYKIETLQWTQDGRAFNAVGYVTKTGDVILSAPLFPNSAFGYNQREFLVSIIEVTLIVVLYTCKGPSL